MLRSRAVREKAPGGVLNFRGKRHSLSRRTCRETLKLRGKIQVIHFSGFRENRAILGSVGHPKTPRLPRRPSRNSRTFAPRVPRIRQVPSTDCRVAGGDSAACSNRELRAFRNSRSDCSAKSENSAPAAPAAETEDCASAARCRRNGRLRDCREFRALRAAPSPKPGEFYNSHRIRRCFGLRRDCQPFERTPCAEYPPLLDELLSLRSRLSTSCWDQLEEVEGGLR
jgi:hypothetical protein